MNRLPVIAAVPNYNMGEQLGDLLPSLIESGYDDIYVLDDNSTDGSREVTRAISTSIHFVDGGENKGAGANRNRIIGCLPCEATVHFIDADVRVETDRMAERVADALPCEPYGYIGGLILNPDGTQSAWNHGPRQSLWGDIGANLQNKIAETQKVDPERAKALRTRFHPFVKDYPDTLGTPVRRQVFWVSEGSMVVNSKAFEEVGGFDERFREHEIQDLGIKMAARGLKRYFDPSFPVTHLDVDVRHYNRRQAMIKAELQIHREHGIKNWFLPDGHLQPAL